MSRVVESIAPARLGRSFRWLLGSSWVSNIGDGIGLATASAWRRDRCWSRRRPTTRCWSTRMPAVAMVVFFVFGIHTSLWATTSTAVRQRAVPNEFQGRVGSVYMIAVQGGLVVGAAVGGLIAQQWGITAPFWFAFVGSALILVAIWQALGHIAHADAESLHA